MTNPNVAVARQSPTTSPHSRPHPSGVTPTVGSRRPRSNPDAATSPPYKRFFSQLQALGVNDSLEFRVLDLPFEQANLPSRFYELVVAATSYHWLEPELRLQRIAELLKPGGLMISETPCIGEGGVVLTTLLPLIGKVLGISYLKTFRVSDMSDLMGNEGFQILESEVPAGRIRICFVVARKR